MRAVGTVKYEYIGKLSSILLGIMVILLFVTMFTGQKIDGASASRWLKIPGTPISFQPSSFAYFMLIIYLCRYLTKKIKRERLPIENILYIFGPSFIGFHFGCKRQWFYCFDDSNGFISSNVGWSIVLEIHRWIFRNFRSFLWEFSCFWL